MTSVVRRMEAWVVRPVHISARAPRLQVPVGAARLTFGLIWLLVVPPALWEVHKLYVPLLGASLDEPSAWSAAVVIVAGIILSIVAHSLAHVFASRALRGSVPEQVGVYPLGDAAQAWPVAPGAASEALVAVSGPGANLMLAGVFFYVWAAQIGTFANTVSLFLAVFNLGIALINLTPAFPFDGGRVVRAVVWHSFESPALGARVGFRLGVLLLVELLAWAAFLAWQQLRFSSETSAATLVVIVLTAVALFVEPAWRPAPHEEARPMSRWGRLRGAGFVAVVVLVLLPAPIALLPMNRGLEAPGTAESVEPMVHVPPELEHRDEGTLLLTTVIPQAPIVMGEWLYAQYDHSIHLTDAKNIVPPNTTPQELAIQGFRDLQESEKTAAVVGLNLAGYPASLTYTGAQVTGIQVDSKANGILMLGDEITAANGKPVATASELSQVLAETPTATSVRLEVNRDDQTLSLDVPLLAPADPASPPKIGIGVSPTSDNYSVPFPVSITPHKIEGGPSAGLMFALAVYGVLSPDDLTSGHRVAGTGTIDLNGNVGTIGGVQQKVVAAERAGAEYFLVPPGNYADAQAAAGDIKVVQVATATQAVEFLKTLAPATPDG